MAQGNPRLAVWEDTGTIRTFELADGVFVQVASLAGFPHLPDAHPAGIANYPSLFWAHDGAFVGIDRALDNKTGSVTVLSEFLVQAGSVDIGTNGFYPRRGQYTFDPSRNTSMLYMEGLQYRNRVAIDADGIPTALDRSPEDTSNADLRCYATDSRSKYALAGFVKPSPSFFWARDTVTGLFPAHTVLDGDEVLVAGFSPDGRYLITGGTDKLQVYKIIDDEPVHIMGISVTGTPVALAMSPDGRGVAVGLKSGSDYSVKILRRIGDMYQATQDLTGGGRLLTYTADGKVLVDAASKIAWSFATGTMQVLTGACVNIPLGQLAQAVSPHVLSPIGVCQFYGSALYRMLSGGTNMDTLKIALLDSTATFDEAHTDLSQVLGSPSCEAYGNGWPQGGKLLTGVDLVDLGDSAAFTADPVTQIIVGGNLTSRYAVIYDASSPSFAPVLFVDFLAENLAAKNSELVLNFRSARLTTFSP